MFDVPPTIKPGDGVKWRRKSKNAVYWKKGEVIQVESVHPLDDSIRFWDERTQAWGHLWPEDFVLVPPDSVETAIALDTESKPEPQMLDSVSESIALDTDSKPEPQVLDSVSESIALDTDSKPEPAEIDSVSSDPIALDTELKLGPQLLDSVSE